ncbi:Cytochrome oxidase assembly [Mucor circinelloides]
MQSQGGTSFFIYISIMVTFQSKPYGQQSAFSPLAAQAKKKPFLYFGLPFLAIMVAGSFGLAQLTQTKFDHRDRRHTKVCTFITNVCPKTPSY